MGHLYIGLVVACLAVGINAGDWNYNDIAAWGTGCDASHMAQSPINIITTKAQYEESLVGISLITPAVEPAEPDSAAQLLAAENELQDVRALDGGNQPLLNSGRSRAAAIVAPEAMQLQNNGHSVVVTLNRDLHIAGSDLNDVYQAHQLHFHWGSTNDQGSEHTVDGKAFPIEMHVVSYDTERYSNIGEALDGSNSLAVLGVLFEVSDDDNPKLAPIIDGLSSILESGTSTELSEDVEVDSLLPEERSKYYRYYGGLTTPPCFESVVWTVFAQTQKISQAQLDAFRALNYAAHDGHADHMVDNFRPVQKLHDRVIHSSFIVGEDDVSSASRVLSGILVFSSSLLLSIAYFAH